MTSTTSTTTTTKKSTPTMKCIQTLEPPSPPSSNNTRSTMTSNNTSIHDKLLLLDSNHNNHSNNHSNTNNAYPSPVWSCTFSHDGKTLATAHGKPNIPCIRIWKLQPQEEEEESQEQEYWELTATLRHDHYNHDYNHNNDDDEDNNISRTIRAIEFAYTPPNVRYILACASFDGTVRIWEDFSFSSNGNMEKFQQQQQPKYQPKQQPKQEISSSMDTNAGWENTAQLEGHENEVKDISWNNTGTLLATCGRDKTIWIWECFLPGIIGSDGNGSTSFHSSIAGNNGSGGGGGGGQGDFECIAVLSSHNGDVKDVEFTSSLNQFGDGDDILLSASYDDTIKVWAEEDGEWYCALTLTNVHSSTIWSIALSSSGVRMFSASADCSLGIWKFYTINEKRQMIKDKQNNKNSNNGDGGDMGITSDGLWKCVGKLPSAHHKQPIYSVHCASSRTGHGRIVSGGGDDAINIYREVVVNNSGSNNVSNDEAPLFVTEITVRKAHDGDVNCVRWHPLDGSLLASAGDDGLVKIWKFSP